MLRPALERLAGRLEGTRLPRQLAWLSAPATHRVFLAIGVVAVIVAAIAVVAGSTKVVVGGVVLRNSSVVRPLVLAVVAFAIARAWRHALTIVPVAMLALLPLAASRETLIAGSRPAHALRTLRDCARPLVETGRAQGGAYAVSPTPLPHTYAFYLQPLGAWDVSPTLDAQAAARALDQPGAQRPLVLHGRPYSDLALQRLHANLPLPPAIRAHPNVVVLLPGPLGACATEVVRAGGRPVSGPFGGLS
jgi:hypothetical protein